MRITTPERFTQSVHEAVEHGAALIKDGSIKDVEIAADAAIAQSKLAANSGFTPVEHGAAEHTNVTRELFIPATNDMDVGITLAASAGLSILRFGDGTTAKTYHSFKVPDDFISFVSLKVIWVSSAAAGNMRWKLQANYGALGEDRSTHTESPAYGETATGGASIINVQEPENPLSLPDIEKGDYVGIALYRDGGHASDTLEEAADEVGLLFTYTAEQ